MSFSKIIVSKIKMATNPLKYAKSIGVNIDDKAILLASTNWGTEPWLIKIGAYTRISKNVTFWNHDGGISVARRLDSKYKNVVKFGFIEVGENCFIGADSTILCNVRIGDNSIVGACSLVTHDIPPNEVWGGVPAKRICSIEEYAEKLLISVPQYDEQRLRINKREETIAIATTFRNNRN